jgi:hypothetical protein
MRAVRRQRDHYSAAYRAVEAVARKILLREYARPPRPDALLGRGEQLIRVMGALAVQRQFGVRVEERQTYRTDQWTEMAYRSDC